MTDSARPIETVEDVIEILESPRASTIEFLECAQLMKVLDHGQLRRTAAERALDSMGTTKHSAVNVLQAARHVVHSTVRNAENLTILNQYLIEAEHWLSEITTNDLLRTNSLEDLVDLVSMTQVLATGSDDVSRIQLCSRLRKLENSKLGAEVVRSIAERKEVDTVAITTYGAALVDIGEFVTAYEHLERALKKAPTNVHVLLTTSRALSCLGRAREAHHLAMNAFTISPDENSARRLLSSAAEVGDVEAFNNAIAVIESALENQAKKMSKNLLLLSAEELVDAKNFEAATLAITELRKYTWTGKNAKRMSKLSAWINSQNQGKLDL
jgi:Flp pilus assembly protein TadD